MEHRPWRKEYRVRKKEEEREGRWGLAAGIIRLALYFPYSWNM
jgi:hypothetical protein